MGDEGQGRQWIERTEALRKEIVGDNEMTNKEQGQPSERDYDELVVFWSR